MTERDLIAAIGAMVDGSDPELAKGMGDDCAVMSGPGETVWLLTTDTLVEDIHFRLRWHPPELLASKSLRVNISDIAAMGGRPRFVLLNLGLPPELDPAFTHALMQGLVEQCNRMHCLLIGGDTVAAPQGVMLSLTLVGSMERDRVIYRHTAVQGDQVWLSGWPGCSAAGLALLEHGEKCPGELAPLIRAHLQPPVRVALGQALAVRQLATAMIDLSDGLATDLAHLCKASGIGAEIRLERLPRHPLLPKAAAFLGVDPLSWMIQGGEDYELLFTAPAANAGALLDLGREMGCQLTMIGTLGRRPGLFLCPGNGQPASRIDFQGFDHFGKPG